MGAGASAYSDGSRNEYMLQRQKPVNGTDIRDMGHALSEIAKLRTLCRLIDPRDLNQFLDKITTGEIPIHDSSPHDYRIVRSNISSVPNPLVPNNKAPPLMPTVYAEDTIVKPLSGPSSASRSRPTTPGTKPLYGSRPNTGSRPTTPKLKGCLKSHTRAHSAAEKKRARFHDDPTATNTLLNGTSAHPKVVTHSESTPTAAFTQPAPHVRHDEAAPSSSMFSVSSSNPSFQPKKHANHYVPLSQVSHNHQSIHEHLKYRLDNRVMSLHEAFQHLDVHNSGYITQDELLNACWYWGIHLSPDDFRLLRETYPPNLATTARGDPRIYYQEFTELMSRIMAPEEEAEQCRNPIDNVLRTAVLDSGLTMKQTFKEFDRDGSGSIDHEEMAKILKTYHIQYTEAQLDDLFVNFDFNRDGRIQYSEFVKMMQGISVYDSNTASTHR